jgi:hypothetical protein
VAASPENHFNASLAAEALAKEATIKPTHVLAISLPVAFAIVWCVQVWSDGGWNIALQGQGRFYNTSAGNTAETSTPSWRERVQSLIDASVRSIKRVGHRRRLAPAHVFFTLKYISARNSYTITGVEAGTRVLCVKDWGPVLLVRAGDLEFEAKRQYLTNDLDVADLAVRNDAEAQQAVESYIARQEQAIEQRNDKWKMQASRQH